MSKEQQINAVCLEYADCQKCPFGAKVFVDKAPLRVFYKGNPDANVVLVGEGPGRDEIQVGTPFVGRAGKQLDKILEYAGIPTEDTFTLNSFVCSDDGIKKPTDEVLRACNDRLRAMLEVVQPAMVVALGLFAWKSMAGIKIQPPLGQYINKAYSFKLDKSDGRRLLIPEYHPSYYLRNPSAKKEAAVRWARIGRIYRALISLK